jgi:hypothetical protein
MTGAQVPKARATLGQLGLGRPLYAAELGRLLRLSGRDPGQTVLRWESGQRGIGGPIALLIELMLAGALPEQVPVKPKGKHS